MVSNLKEGSEFKCSRCDGTLLQAMKYIILGKEDSLECDDTFC